jgi:hypothetical protein
MKADALKPDLIATSFTRFEAAFHQSLRQLPGIRHMSGTKVEEKFAAVIQRCARAVFGGLFARRIVAKLGLRK